MENKLEGDFNFNFNVKCGNFVIGFNKKMQMCALVLHNEIYLID